MLRPSTQLKKLIFTLVIMVKMFQSYFQAHTIVLLMDPPIKTVLHHPNTSEYFAKWASQFFEFDIKFHPKSSIKAQIFADFILECTIPNEDGTEVAKSSSMALEEQINMNSDLEDQ